MLVSVRLSMRRSLANKESKIQSSASRIQTKVAEKSKI
jgi:hypothetical protein